MVVSRPASGGAQELVQAPPDGDAGFDVSDFASLYRLHVQDVSRWVRRLGGRDLDVEDVVHDVFMVALRRLSHFDPHRAAFGTWLFGITAKLVSSRLRRERWRGRLRGLFGYDVDEAATPRTQPHDGHGDSPQELRDEARRRLDNCLARLPESQRIAIVLFELEGRSCAEIANMTGTSLDNVYVRVHRGRLKLAALLRQADSEVK